MSCNYPYLCAFRLGVNEDKDYALDMRNHLVDASGTVVDGISNVVWQANPATDIQLHSDFVQDTVVGVWAKTPKAAQAYVIKATVTTNLNRIVEEKFILGGVEKAKAY